MTDKSLVDTLEVSIPAKPPVPPVDARELLVQLIEGSENKNFVFFFGTPRAGKTAILGSMLQSMEAENPFGTVHVLGKDGYFEAGVALWQNIRGFFDSRRFPPRTDAGATIQLHARFQPREPQQKALDIIFLEMGGEDLRVVSATSTGVRALPLHIDQFLLIPGLRMMFLLTASWREAKQSDRAMSEFIDYLIGKNSSLADNRIVMLVTKWDTYPEKKTVTAEDYVKKHMPVTYGKLRDPKNLIGSYSIGTIVSLGKNGEESPDDIIQSFDHKEGQKLFNRIRETFTGESFIKPPSFWKKLGF
jgi:hypothetical protein